MKWETPAFVEINMSAEIGGYQSDFDDDREPAGPPLSIEMGTLKGFPNPPAMGSAEQSSSAPARSIAD